jgi:opacity protein-like surface antigen
MKRILAAALLVAPFSAACAQTATPPRAAAPGGPVTYGAGHKLCSDWSAAETKADQSEYFANRFWVAGFMSAYNVYVSPPGYDIARGLTPDDMKSFMHTRCAGNPAETIATAATAFLVMLKARPDH